MLTFTKIISPYERCNECLLAPMKGPTQKSKDKWGMSLFLPCFEDDEIAMRELKNVVGGVKNNWVPMFSNTRPTVGLGGSVYERKLLRRIELKEKLNVPMGLGDMEVTFSTYPFTGTNPARPTVNLAVISKIMILELL